MKYMTVGEFARAGGVNVETVRFYERKGLLPQPARKPSGYRLYSDEDVARLKFIRHAKELGFSLREIKDLLELRVDPETGCDEVRRQAEAKIREVEEKIAQLHRIKRALETLVAACRGKGPTGECPIIEALEHDDVNPN
ncbi:MAG: MerR family transcriptional regulator [Calditrichaeota bacterium]|nr:MAG: MerR family transcriptional regulator [Calditrichota bacterium]